MKKLIEKLKIEGGRIMSTASLDVEDIEQARASDRIQLLLISTCVRKNWWDRQTFDLKNVTEHFCELDGKEITKMVKPLNPFGSTFITLVIRQ